MVRTSQPTVEDIARALGTQAMGNAKLTINRATQPDMAGPEDLALAMSPAYGDALKASKARVAIVWPDAPWQDMGLEAAIAVPRARLAMAQITSSMDPGPALQQGIHPNAIIEDGATIGQDVSIGPFVHVNTGAQIGDGTRLGAHVTIAEQAKIGKNCLILQNAHIGARVTMGDRCIIQPAAVIGGDGFSFVTPEESGVERARRNVGDQGEITEQTWHRIHSLGSVTLGDDVEIGAGTCIDKGTVVDTTIGNRTKIDNLVHIGHNNRIGEDCLICGQVGMAGSSHIGNRVVLGGQCGVNDNITIGDDVVAGGASKIFTRVKAGEVILGYPAMDMKAHMSIYRASRRLPKLAQQVAELKKLLSKSSTAD